MPRKILGKRGQREFVAGKKAEAKQAREKRERATPSVFRRYVGEATANIETGDWSDATPSTFLGLFAVLHKEVYGVETDSEIRAEWRTARVVVGRFVREEFTRADEVVEFMRWAWVREQEREEWRRRNGRGGFRLTWRLLFGARQLADYRLDVARRRGVA